ncbi:hypothetical protein GCM10010913_17010 [Paenibacillus aceti]|uniref:Uncharacterized protein n=1 Tax=Paenibacillus aceti TaxID=1820010 RepID=A0ABQ1VTS9_9BACL|nr:hypothetical protein GCM10010913_17010 [Paenibacillus aceti]
MNTPIVSALPTEGASLQRHRLEGGKNERYEKIQNRNEKNLDRVPWS